MKNRGKLSALLGLLLALISAGVAAPAAAVQVDQATHIATVEASDTIADLQDALNNGATELLFDGNTVPDGKFTFQNQGDLTINAAVTIRLTNNADVTILVTNRQNITGYAGIRVNKGASLTFDGDGTGSLTVDGNSADSGYGISITAGATGLTIANATVNIKNTVWAGLNGQIGAGNAITLNGGTLNIDNCGQNGEAGVFLKAATLNLNSGTFNVTESGHKSFGPIYAEGSTIIMGDGGDAPLQVHLSNYANGTSTYVANFVSAGSSLTINKNADVTVDVQGTGTTHHGFYSGGTNTILVDGGKLTFNNKTNASTTTAINGQKSMTVKNGATVSAAGFSTDVGINLWNLFDNTQTITGGSTNFQDAQSVTRGEIANAANDRIVANSPVNAAGDPLTRFDLSTAANKTLSLTGEKAGQYSYVVGAGHGGTQYVWAPKATLKFVLIHKDEQGADTETELAQRLLMRGTNVATSEVDVAGIEVPDNIDASENYVLKWFNEKELTTAWNQSDAVTAAEKTVYAKLVAVYDVTFDTDGGSANPESQQVEDGAQASEPADPTKAGYKFAGWYDAEGKLFDFATPITGDLELKAHWEAVAKPAEPKEEAKEVKLPPTGASGIGGALIGALALGIAGASLLTLRRKQS